VSKLAFSPLWFSSHSRRCSSYFRISSGLKLELKELMKQFLEIDLSESSQSVQIHHYTLLLIRAFSAIAVLLDHGCRQQILRAAR